MVVAAHDRFHLLVRRLHRRSRLKPLSLLLHSFFNIDPRNDGVDHLVLARILQKVVVKYGGLLLDGNLAVVLLLFGGDGHDALVRIGVGGLLLNKCPTN